MTLPLDTNSKAAQEHFNRHWGKQQHKRLLKTYHPIFFHNAPHVSVQGLQ